MPRVPSMGQTPNLLKTNITILFLHCPLRVGSKYEILAVIAILPSHHRRISR
jgi:hypothetical protein